MSITDIVDIMRYQQVLVNMNHTATSTETAAKGVKR